MSVSTNQPMSKDLNATLARRQEELLRLVETKGQISVDELARHLDVSDDTIRRNLQNLEQRKLLLRTHARQSLPLSPVSDRVEI